MKTIKNFDTSSLLNDEITENLKKFQKHKILKIKQLFKCEIVVKCLRLAPRQYNFENCEINF